MLRDLRPVLRLSAEDLSNTKEYKQLDAGGTVMAAQVASYPSGTVPLALKYLPIMLSKHHPSGPCPWPSGQVPSTIYSPYALAPCSIQSGLESSMKL